MNALLMCNELNHSQVPVESERNLIKMEIGSMMLAVIEYDSIVLSGKALGFQLYVLRESD